MKLYKIKKSNIDKRGLCASKNISAGSRIIEYIGKIISNKEVEKNPKFDNSKDIYLTEGEIKLLLKLIDKKNNIVLREELADSDFSENELRKIDVQVTRLRQKIEKNPKQPHFLKTIRGKGYKLICNEL